MKSSTQVSLVAASVAAALGSSAHALPPSAWTTNTNPINVFYAAGASAGVQTVYVAVSQLLVTTSIDVYTDGSGSSKHPQSLSYLIVSGTGNAAAGSLSGKPIGFIYKYNGGSSTNGIQPFVTGQTPTLNYPTLGSIASASSAPAGYSGSNPTSLNPDYVFSPSDTDPHTPAWGLSDQEPSLSTYPWNGNASGITSTIGLTAIPVYVEGFGVAVTANVFAQKKIWSTSELAAVYQLSSHGGIVTAWSQLIGDNGAPLTVPGPINIIDRNSGSATKAAANLFFFNYPRSTTHFGGIAPPFSVNGGNVNNYTGTILVTSGTATSSFQDIKEASNVSVVDDLNNAQKAGLGGIAMLDFEFPPVFEQASSGTNSYDFVAINGVYPDSETGSDFINNPAGGANQYSNVVNGSYPFATQASFNYKSAPTGFQALVQANLSAESIAAVNGGSGFPSAADGVLLDPATTGTTDPGNLEWTRSAVSTNAPLFYGAVSAPLPDPL